jgi:hypothetical protein
MQGLETPGVGAAVSPLVLSLMALYITGWLLSDRRQNGTRIADWLPARAHDAINRLVRTHPIATRALMIVQAFQDDPEIEYIVGDAFYTVSWLTTKINQLGLKREGVKHRKAMVHYRERRWDRTDEVGLVSGADPLNVRSR